MADQEAGPRRTRNRTAPSGPGRRRRHRRRHQRRHRRGSGGVAAGRWD